MKEAKGGVSSLVVHRHGAADALEVRGISGSSFETLLVAEPRGAVAKLELARQTWAKIKKLVAPRQPSPAPVLLVFTYYHEARSRASRAIIQDKCSVSHQPESLSNKCSREDWLIK
jgi:hypothetical protein